ncbi:nuclear transport factor 2 family protein [Hymenobacter sp. BT770]|uniref:nuclear transport factor 2 family protein n=1 Tax=Hymenobacter sp. BT770 TaxID=2886942 RepID=UPI001D12C42D|nr:nuclear transport factor 2 family protein [Hymenobacter sp. BT770]MCC3154510.1 nuclear transport factor 2 family protein [Hymenobacter sp. BT770]MDO3416426.1 nuclear transport factor 2 family protein [Hymenobacter sp. BT770]
MKNHFTIGAFVASLLPFNSQAQAPHAAVVAAETAFAAQAMQESTPAAFLANSAPKAWVTENGKWANAQDVWRSRPARPGSRLTWYPVLADAAQSGDLGYTTGPWTALLNDKPQASGEYVTVWRKQPDGKWKFVVDMGVERIGTAPAKAATVPQPRLLAAAATPSTAPSNIVLEVDRKFAAAQLLKPGAAYQQHLSTEARLYRPGLSMMQGAAAAANMKNLDGGYQFVPVDGYLAAAGDLGYVVGTLQRSRGAKHPEENGSYLRIWRREAVDGWRLVLEVFNFAPSPTAAAAAPAVTPAADGAAGATSKRPQ